MTETVADLALALRQLAAAHPVAAPFLALWPQDGAAAIRPVVPASLPVLDAMAALPPSGVPAADRVLRLVTRLAPLLAWHQTYDEASTSRHFLDSYGWTEVVGRRGPYASDGLAAGLLMLGPDTLYPAHRHRAEEIYIPVSGNALWLKGEHWARRSPNEAIHHAPDVVHATRTETEPLLAVYLWRGDALAEPARLV